MDLVEVNPDLAKTEADLGRLSHRFLLISKYLANNLQQIIIRELDLWLYRYLRDDSGGSTRGHSGSNGNSATSSHLKMKCSVSFLC
jgi:hypothetical protein